MSSRVAMSSQVAMTVWRAIVTLCVAMLMSCVTHRLPFLSGLLKPLCAVLIVLLLPDAHSVELRFNGSHRVRYESLTDGPRPQAAESDEILVSRLLASIRWHHGAFFGQVELQDSRAWLHSEATPLGTDMVNSLEPLQFWVGWQSQALPLQIALGRMTKEWTTRRLVARNRYRNTLNSFSGLDAQWRGERWHVNAFALRPLQREPTERPALERNEFELDRSSSGQRFLGVEIKPATAPDWSLYVLKLDESDRPGFATRNRQLLTLGGQWSHLDPHSGWSQAAELALQTGLSRATRDPEDKQDLDHRAWFAHLELARSWDSPLQPKLRLALDYGSGDRDPTDRRTERFDTLFGARRFEYGPSGIYAIQARANMISPELRWTARVGSGTQVMTAWRGFWLDQPTDSHAGTGYRASESDPSRHIGQQWEARLRHNLTPAFQLELGAVYLNKGAVLRGEDFNRADADSRYLYVATTLRW